MEWIWNDGVPELGDLYRPCTRWSYLEPMSAIMSRSMARKNAPEKKEQREEVYAWHAHSHHEALTMLDSAERGLSNEEAKIRLKAVGSNAFTEEPEPGFLSRLFGQLKSPIAIVLLIAVVITVVLAEYVDAGVITFALFIAVAIGILQEGRASQAFKKLSSSQEHIAVVWRKGEKIQIESSQLVPGDVVELQSGMQVPADLRLTKSKKLTINEAALTGEWMVVDKDVESVPVGTPLAERHCMAFMGTYVSEGYGTGVVVATGDTTVVGELAQDVQAVVEVETPLQYEMKTLSRVLLYIILVIIGIIFALGIWQGQTLHDMLLMSIAVAVASIPEGLPAAVTIILAVGMEALLKRGGLVRNLMAAETLGSTTYVLTDKTGTLTQARMAVTEFIHGDKTSGNLPNGEITADPVTKTMLEVGLCAADSFTDHGDGSASGVVRGDPVEVAILEAAAEIGVLETGASLRGSRLDYLSFTSENRFAAGLSPRPARNTEYQLCVNGAPEWILEAATSLHTADGTRPMTPADVEAFEAAIRTRTKEGKRLVAVGYKHVAYNDIPEETNGLIDDLVFVGIFVFHDPVRKGVRAAIKGVKEAGAEVVLMTGDNPETALSIARQVEITDSEGVALTGNDLEGMSDEAILEALETTKVYARVLPKQKMRIAQLLQRRGEIVAMTGDGVNDAPALQRANIGIAVGSGTEVAKEASDLVLVNDTFATIHSAIEEGRRIISNLRKIIGYLLSTSLSEVVLIGGALIVGAPAPLLPAQILWANIIEEGLMSVAFAFEKGEPGAMKRKPQDIHAEGILSKHMMWFMGFVIVILSGLSLALYFYYRSIGTPLDELRSIMFIAISMDSLFIAFAFRSLGVPVWRIPLRNNLFFLGSFMVSLFLLVVVLSVPFLQGLLSYTPLPFGVLLIIVGFSFASLVTVELAKLLFLSQKN